MNHYDTLGVPPDADPEQVKAAHRRAVKRTHPDKGGDPEDFEKVQRAWLVLSDPARRSKYDATGEDEVEPDNRLGLIGEFVTTAFDQAVGGLGDDYRFADLVKLAAAKLDERRRGLEQQLANARQELEAQEDLAGRLTFDGAGPDLIGTVLRNRVAGVRSAITMMERDIGICGDAAEYLAGYSFRADERPPEPVGQWPSQEKLLRELHRHLADRTTFGTSG